MIFAFRFNVRICRQMMMVTVALAAGLLFVNKPAAAQTATTWTTCAQEEQLCAFSGTRTVRYGANGIWSVRQVTASGGGVLCVNEVFGDPIPRTVKSCQLESGTTTPTTTTTGWAFCADENSLCSFTGTRRVRYGADTRWVTRSVTASGGGVQCSNAVFGDPASGTVKTCQLETTTTTTTPTPTPTPIPTGWIFCANEDVLCSFTGTRRVRYGADTRWVTRDVAASGGGIMCSNSTFGDPARGTLKRCELAATTTTTTQQPPIISGTPATSVTVGSVYRFQPTASDPNGNTLAFTITNRPSWATFNTATGLLTGQPTLSNVGSFANIVISVSDGTSTVRLAAFAINVVAPATSSGTAEVSWTPPTTNSDGSTLTNLAGYRIVYGTSASALTQQVQVASAGVSSYVISGLSSGTHYFAVRAYNSVGAESALSTVASKTIP